MPNKMPSVWLVPNIIMDFRKLSPLRKKGYDSSTEMVNTQPWEILVIYKRIYATGILDN